MISQLRAVCVCVCVRVTVPVQLSAPLLRGHASANVFSSLRECREELGALRSIVKSICKVCACMHSFVVVSVVSTRTPAVLVHNGPCELMLGVYAQVLSDVIDDEADLNLLRWPFEAMRLFSM